MDDARKHADDVDEEYDEDQANDFYGDADRPVFRSMAGDALHDADFPTMQSLGTSETYDALDEPVYRSLGVMRSLPAADPLSEFGGLGLGGGLDGSLQKPALVHSGKAAPLGLDALQRPQLARSAPAAPAAEADAGANLRSRDEQRAALQRAAPVPLPLPPFALANTHTFLQWPKGGDSLAARVASVLDAAAVDGAYSAFGEAKCKWKAVHYEAGASVCFRVRLFRNAEGSAIFEMQRRRGDLLHFKRVYHDVRARLADCGLAKECAGRAPIPRAVLPPSGDQALPPLSDAEMREGMRPLFAMLMGEFHDARREAAAKLVAFSASLPHAPAYEDKVADLVALFAPAGTAGAAEHVDADLRRCAVSMVANLCEVRPEAQARVVGAGALTHLLPLASGTTGAGAAHGGGGADVDEETQRESARLLSLLCARYAEQVRDASAHCDAARQLLARCDAIGDHRLREHVKRAQAMLQA